MKIRYDPANNAKNIQERRLSFDRAADFDFETALFEIDDRRDYGETRIRALGSVGQRIYSLVFVKMTDGIRVVSFRKANRREVRKYGNTPKP